MSSSVVERAWPVSVAGLLFDLDGTLTNSEHLHFLSTAQVLAAEGFHLSVEQNAMYVGWAEHDCWLSLNQRFGLSLDPVLAIEARTAAYLALLREQPLPHLPGSHELLSWGQARGLPMAVASSLPIAQIDASLAAAGLADYFSVRCSGHDDVPPGRGKPEPDVYLAAAARLGVDARQCLAFEDSTTGIRSARAAGCFVISVPCADQPPQDCSQAHWVCSSLLEALQRLQRELP